MRYWTSNNGSTLQWGEERGLLPLVIVVAAATISLVRLVTRWPERHSERSVVGGVVSVLDSDVTAWSAYWTVTSRRSVETAVIYVIMTLLLTTCPAVCVYYSMSCTRLINSMHQYTQSLDSQTKVNSFFIIKYLLITWALQQCSATALPVIIIYNLRQGGDYAICSVCVHSFCLWADFIETWCYDWTYYGYQTEELTNFSWWSGPGCGFRITFRLPSPLQNREFSRVFFSISHTVAGRFSWHSAKWLTPTW